VVRQLEYIIAPSLLTREQLKEKHGLWHHFDFHGCFSGQNKDLVYEKLASQLEISRFSLLKAKYLFLTLGTANVFINKGNNQIVANNHKFPIEDFIKHRLTIEEIKEAFLKVIKALNELNPELQIVFTVSPVRYTREGLIENSRSKAILHMAIDQIQSVSSSVSYFPAFEVFIDDLRDYRYYNADLIHPNEQGIEYVWELFKSWFFDEKTENLEKEISRIIRSTEHRPIHEKSALHLAFLEKLNSQIESLVEEHPFLNMKRELELISKAPDQAL
jgi:lysophospholipase L1-like esterase